MIIYENYLFKCNKITTSKKYWLRVERECDVCIHTSVDNEFISISKDHNHATNHTVDPKRTCSL